jgi:hypothetical protein
VRYLSSGLQVPLRARTHPQSCQRSSVAPDEKEPLLSAAGCAFARRDTAVTLPWATQSMSGERSVTDVQLINWTIEEAKLLRAERPQPSDLDPIPSLDQLLARPEGDLSGRPTGPVDPVDKSAPIQSTAEAAPAVPPSNDAVIAPQPKAASYSAVAVSVSYSISADVRTEQPKPLVPAEIAKPDLPAAAVDRDRMIALRWVLRDIRSNRLKWWPINQHDLRTLVEIGLVELRDGIPVLTNKGARAID